MKILLVISLMAIGLGGCTSMWKEGRDANGPPLSIGAAGQARMEDAAIDERVYKGDPLTAVPAKSLAYALLDQSDVSCLDYLIGLSKTNNTIASSLDITSLSLSSIAAVIKPEGTAAALSTTSAISGNVKQTLATNVLGGKQFSLLYDAVINGRKVERKAMEDKIDRGDFTDRSAESILASMQPYHFDCGINFGLHYLNETLQAQTAEKLK